MTPMIEADLEQIVGDVMPLIEAAQALVPSQTGLPHQGLRSHSEPPEYGHPTAPDLLDRTPAWQDKTWRQILDDLADHGIVAPELWRVALSVDIYECAQGTGYVVRAAVLIDGQEWERRINRGPLTWMEHGWREVLDDEVEL